MLRLDLIHAIIQTKFPELHIVRSGQDAEQIPLPYLEYAFILEKKYAPYQVDKFLTEDVPGFPEMEYKNPNTSDYQYALIDDPKIVRTHKTSLNDIYNFLTTDGFKIELDKIDIKANLISDIREVNLEKSKFFERRFVFEKRYFWADVFIEDYTGVGVIQNVDVTPIDPAGPVISIRTGGWGENWGEGWGT